MLVSAVIAILLLSVTFVFSYLITRSFGRGLKDSRWYLFKYTPTNADDLSFSETKEHSVREESVA